MLSHEQENSLRSDEPVRHAVSSSRESSRSSNEESAPEGQQGVRGAEAKVDGPRRRPKHKRQAPASPQKVNLTFDLIGTEKKESVEFTPESGGLTINDVRKKVEEKFNIPRNAQKIFFKGKSVPLDDRNLAEIGIQNNSTLLVFGQAGCENNVQKARTVHNEGEMEYMMDMQRIDQIDDIVNALEEKVMKVEKSMTEILENRLPKNQRRSFLRKKMKEFNTLQDECYQAEKDFGSTQKVLMSRNSAVDQNILKTSLDIIRTRIEQKLEFLKKNTD